MRPRPRLAALEVKAMKKSLPAIAMIILCISGGHAHGADSVGAPPLSADSTQIPVKITGGHETDPRDGGRPVILIASALKVTPDVFRNVFSNVHPSHNGGPTDEEARANKRVLLDGLGPYGITDDRINEVSNYYRYAKWRGQMWRTREATALATVSHGVVTGFNVTDPGSGYSSPPEASIPGYPNVSVQVTLAFGTNFTSNGSIKEMKLVNGAAGASQPPVRSSSDASTEGERRPAPRNRPPGGGADTTSP
jgi:hypothetical protein